MLLLAGCGSESPRRYSVDQVKAAFATQGFDLSEKYATQPFPANGVVRLADRSRFILVAVWPGNVHDSTVRKELKKGNVEVLEMRSTSYYVLKAIKALQQLH